MTIITAMLFSAIPALSMLLFTVLGLDVDVPPSLAGSFQHFAAGILLCTIATELLPVMYNAEGVAENIAAFFGFFGGIGTLLLVGYFVPDPCEFDDDCADSCADEKEEKASSSMLGSSMLGSSIHRRRASLTCAATKFGVQSSEREAPSESDHLLAEGPKPYPSEFILAIAVDGGIDGLLIGIAIAAGTSAALMMAISLTVEMSFLGLTLAMALKGQPRNKSLQGSCLGPLGIMIGSFLGGCLSSGIENPTLLIGLLSFGVSAVLFMVAEELLLQAHEGGGHTWWVDLQLYTGFYASILMSKVVPDD